MGHPPILREEKRSEATSLTENGHFLFSKKYLALRFFLLLVKARELGKLRKSEEHD